MDTEHLLIQTYAAFNARDIDAVLALLHPDVEWPNGMEGGTMRGHRAVREYWTRQWRLLDPTVISEGFTITPDGRVAVRVHQTVRDLVGTVLKDETVHCPPEFYLRRQPFLHFHLVAGGCRRADIKGREGWLQIDLPRPASATKRQAFLRALRRLHGERVAKTS